MRWTILIPVKALPEAKTRLLTSRADESGHADLVEAIRADTIAAAMACSEVARVLLVVDDAEAPTPSGVEVVVQQRSGLNAALSDGAIDAARRWPSDGIAVLLGDVPALRAADLADALRHAATAPRAFVADHTGLGTTLLTVLPGNDLAPEFGAGSAARHGVSALALPAAPGLRQDVDTPQDLARALELGVGPATAAVAEQLSLHTVHLDSA